MVGARHDRGQAAHARCMTACRNLRNHPAHGNANKMRLFQAQRIQQADAVIGHVMQGVVGGSALSKTRT